MREKLARGIALLSTFLVLGLCWVFAALQNPAPAVAAPAPTAAPVPALTSEAPVPASTSEVPVAPVAPVARADASSPNGAEVFIQSGCARCHSVAGKGSRRSPLDGVGKKLSQEELRRWITPNKNESDPFIASHAQVALTAEQREALIVYLMSLRD